MELDESLRRELFESLDRVLGTRPAAALMAHLPPAGWAELATKHDLAELERRIDLRFEALDHRFEALDHRFEGLDHRFEGLDHRFEAMEHRIDASTHRLAGELRAEMVSQTRALFLGVAAMTFTTAGLAFAAARFGG